MLPPAGEASLARLLATLNPVLNPGEFVFCTASPGLILPTNRVLGFFRENEGQTLIIPRELADAHGLPYTYVAAWLTLTVHSSLAAVGLTAAVATALARQHISCNVVAAFHHDHLFVAHSDAERALAALKALTAEASGACSAPKN